jgi:aconitate hydratase
MQPAGSGQGNLAKGRNSLRTFPRSFPGRSGTADDLVWPCSPETAAAAALTGRITDPRGLGFDYPPVELPASSSVEAQSWNSPFDPTLRSVRWGATDWSPTSGQPASSRTLYSASTR